MLAASEHSLQLFRNEAVLQLLRGNKRGGGCKKRQYENLKNNITVKENSDGRVERFGQNWAVRDWRDHIKDLNMKASPGGGVKTNSGKIIFYLTNSHQIICDLNGYWRHLDGQERYLNSDGIPDNNENTHFWASEAAKSKFK